MPYELRGGEYVKGGKLYGWTGDLCNRCDGSGEWHDDETGPMTCPSCAGTGDHHGLMPVQPADLPADTE